MIAYLIISRWPLETLNPVDIIGIPYITKNNEVKFAPPTDITRITIPMSVAEKLIKEYK